MPFQRWFRIKFISSWITALLTVHFWQCHICLYSDFTNYTIFSRNLKNCFFNILITVHKHQNKGILIPLYQSPSDPPMFLNFHFHHPTPSTHHSIILVYHTTYWDHWTYSYTSFILTCTGYCGEMTFVLLSLYSEHKQIITYVE